MAGCSGNGNPVEPGSGQEPSVKVSTVSCSQTQLWGYWDVSIDIENQVVEAVPNRSMMFAANVVEFLNASPSNLRFSINDTVVNPDCIDVDIDVSISHPFPGLPMYHGYDVRGIFMGDGSGILTTTGDTFAVSGAEQGWDTHLPNSYAPDGYTRWYNISEFSEGGMPMFQYTQGMMASPGFDGDATLNPYKYFADSLDEDEDLWTWLGSHADQNGVFSSGATNTRNYTLCFPNSTGVTFGYGVVANWDGDQHPSNAPEAVACDLVDSSSVYYVDASNNGGEVVLDISLWDWDSEVIAGVMEDYSIIIETDVLSSPYELTLAEMTPSGGGDHYSTYQVEIEADNVTEAGVTDLWVIVKCDEETYENDFGSNNLAGDDPLTACFRYGLDVSDTPSNLDPVCDVIISSETPMPAEDFSPVTVTFDATGSYDPDGDPLTFEWDFDADGNFDEDPDDAYEGDPENPTHYYRSDFNDDVTVRLSDGNGGESECSVAVEVTAHQSKNIQLRSGVQAVDLGVDPENGDLRIVYEDHQVLLYTLGGWYDDGAYQYQCMWNNADVIFMDVAADGYAMYMGIGDAGYGCEFNIKDSSGNTTTGMGLGMYTDQFFQDCTNFGTEGTYANNLAMYMGIENLGMGLYNFYVFEVTSPYDYPMSYFVSDSMPYSPVDGYYRVFHEYVQGMDTGMEGTDFWFLEAPDFYCAAFRKTPYSSYYHLTYNDSYFGAGSEQTDDTGWTADVCDLARDMSDQFHVLDLVDDEGVIKVFTGSASGGESIGHYGDSDTISSTPLKIDGGDFDEKMFVLHGNSADGYFLSVFMPSEYPDS